MTERQNNNITERVSRRTNKGGKQKKEKEGGKKNLEGRKEWRGRIESKAVSFFVLAHSPFPISRQPFDWLVQLSVPRIPNPKG